jgi:MarR-like DNA-binding transcriptional regulator SgrR of sgrS sRNA
MSTDSFRDFFLQQLASCLACSARHISRITLKGMPASDISEQALAEVAELIL